MTVTKAFHKLEGEVMDMQWVGPQKQVVMVLTENAILSRSPDNGRTFESQMPKIQQLAKDGKKSITGVRFMTVSAADPNCLLMVGNNNAHFVTKDAGDTYALVNSVVPFEDIKLHPYDANAMLAAEDTCASKKSKECYRKLWISGLWRELELPSRPRAAVRLVVRDSAVNAPRLVARERHVRARQQRS